MFLPKVDPEDVLLISVLLENRLKALLEALHWGLTSSKEGEARQLNKSRWRKKTAALCRIVRMTLDKVMAEIFQSEVIMAEIIWGREKWPIFRVG